MHPFTVTRVVGPVHQAGLGSAMPGEVVELMVGYRMTITNIKSLDLAARGVWGGIIC